MSTEDERHGQHHEYEERHEILWRLRRIDCKLDLLLAKAADEKEIAALTAKLSADDAKLQASVEKAKAALDKPK